MVPLFVVTLFLLVAIWTFSCAVVFMKDCYVVIIFPYVVQPIIVRASKYSMDEVFTIVCDPTQLASYISALFVVPVTLYTLPTTPQQRAQILLSTFLPVKNSRSINNNKNDDDDDDDDDDDTTQKIFTEAGGWKYLLPKSIQKIVDESNNILPTVVTDSDPGPDNIPFYESVVVEETGDFFHDIGNASTEDEEESNDDEHIEKERFVHDEPRHVSSKLLHTTVGKESTEKSSNSCNGTKVPVSYSSTKHRPTDPMSNGMELPNLFFKIVMDMLDHKFLMACQRLERHRSAMVLTAITTGAILALQFRNSRTARTMIKSVMHMLLATTSSVTLLGSLLALLTPYVHQRMTVVQQQQQTRGSNQLQTDDICHWSTTFLSLLRTNFTIMSDIPKSIPTPPLVKKNIRQFLSKWKGTLALFLLTYFQYRYRKLIQQRRYNRS